MAKMDQVLDMLELIQRKRIFRPHFPSCAGACGAMDNASDYGSEDSRFESWQARKPDFESNMMSENESTCHDLSVPQTSLSNM